jgi:hypothetical protein
MKLILLVCFIASSQAAVLRLWERFPGENLLKSIGILFGALGIWLLTTAITFLIFWTFFTVIVAISRWIWDRFYRTPTL